VIPFSSVADGLDDPYGDSNPDRLLDLIMDRFFAGNKDSIGIDVQYCPGPSA
jgi:hypothetical protein